jgi:drug/metabolite transporter (DMT)-like permease
LAILLWAGSISIQRKLTEFLGPLVTGAVANAIAGILGCLILLVRPSFRRGLRGASAAKTAVCGALFVFYAVCFVCAVGLASGRQQALEVGVINYLWPVLTLVLSIPLLGSRPKALLPLGVAIGLAGAVLATALQRDLSWASFVHSLRDNAWPYMLSLFNAIAWAFYSNLTRRWVREVPGGVVFIFLLVSAAVMGVLSPLQSHAPRWSTEVLLPLLVQALGPALAAYILWETAMRLGDVTFVACAAYLTPVLSLIASCLILQMAATEGLWIGSALVVLGAVVCRLSIREPKPALGAHGQ